jgi:hypothetical protein
MNSALGNGVVCSYQLQYLVQDLVVIKRIPLNFELKPGGGQWPFEPKDLTQPFLPTTLKLESKCAFDDSRSVATYNGGPYG